MWVAVFLLFCIPALLLNCRRREITQRCRFNAQKKGEQINWDFVPCNASQLCLWFCPFPLSLLPADGLSCLPTTLSFALDLAGELNICSHDDSRHARGCLVQRGPAGGAAPARPAAMHRTSSLLHHVPGTSTPQSMGQRGLFQWLMQSTEPHSAVRTSQKTSRVQCVEGSLQNRSSHKSVPKDSKREAPEIGERDFYGRAKMRTRVHEWVGSRR